MSDAIPCRHAKDRLWTSIDMVVEDDRLNLRESWLRDGLLFRGSFASHPVCLHSSLVAVKFDPSAIRYGTTVQRQ